MDIHQTLVEHHRQLDNLFDSYTAARAEHEAGAESLFAEFESALVAHFEAEELHLFPVLEGEFPEEIRALREEHELLRRRLGAVSLGAQEIDASALAQLATQLRDHGRREDNMLYRLVNEAADSDRYRRLVEFLETTHARLMEEE